MNAVDIGILIIIGLFAVGGLRRGFMLGVVDLVAFGLAIVFAARAADFVARPLLDWGFPEGIATAAGFIIAAIVSYALIGLAVRVIVAPLGAFGGSASLAWVNGILGLLPGAVRGLAIAALALMFASALPPEFGWRAQVADSQLAAPLTRAGRGAWHTGLTWAGVDPSTIGGLQLPSASASGQLPFSGVTEVEIDGEAEEMLLDLINQERAIAGLKPLQPDKALAEVGRRHGREMFELGYSSHDSPVTGSPKDRIAAAGLMYLLSAENIAFAPSAEAAHEGLMDSPAYRANILNPGFTRVGVSALRSDEHGLMVVQEFGS
jgi:uncharacterized protein YkwD/uncharacterized membrane protein required for colicin V production